MFKQEEDSVIIAAAKCHEDATEILSLFFSCPCFHYR